MSPPRLIVGSIADGGRIADDPWQAIESVDAIAQLPGDAPLLVPRELWDAERVRLLARGGPLGVRLEPEDEAASIAPDLAHLAMVAIDFPKFTDGRGYSTARLLRERHGYTGRLRAVGDVLRDQLFYLLRCGFDEFAMKHQDRIDEALSAYGDFTIAYQAAVDRKQPLFARRVAGS